MPDITLTPAEAQRRTQLLAELAQALGIPTALGEGPGNGSHLAAGGSEPAVGWSAKARAVLELWDAHREQIDARTWQWGWDSLNLDERGEVGIDRASRIANAAVAGVLDLIKGWAGAPALRVPYVEDCICDRKKDEPGYGLLCPVHGDPISRKNLPHEEGWDLTEQARQKLAELHGAAGRASAAIVEQTRQVLRDGLRLDLSPKNPPEEHAATAPRDENGKFVASGYAEASADPFAAMHKAMADVYDEAIRQPGPSIDRNRDYFPLRTRHLDGSHREWGATASELIQRMWVLINVAAAGGFPKGWHDTMVEVAHAYDEWREIHNLDRHIITAWPLTLGPKPWMVPSAGPVHAASIEFVEETKAEGCICRWFLATGEWRKAGCPIHEETQDTVLRLADEYAENQRKKLRDQAATELRDESDLPGIDRGGLNFPIAGMAAHKTHEPVLSALDRCEHGRHRADNCFSCPDGQSAGNLFLTPGTRIGTNLYGQPIIAPEQDDFQRGYSENWVPEGRVK